MSSWLHGDPTLFWTAVAAIGQVVGAIATAAAVITSLWVVLSERRPRLRVGAGLRLIVSGDGTPAIDAIGIRIANVGIRRVQCVGVGWRSGWLNNGPRWLRRQHALQNADYVPGSPQLPFYLDAGEEKTLILAVKSYQVEVAEPKRVAFFFRKPPWAPSPRPTRIDVVISLAAHRGVFKRVEPDLAHFLAFGAVPRGAAEFNRRAGIVNAAD